MLFFCFWCSFWFFIFIFSFWSYLPVGVVSLPAFCQFCAVLVMERWHTIDAIYLGNLLRCWCRSWRTHCMGAPRNFSKIFAIILHGRQLFLVYFIRNDNDLFCLFVCLLVLSRISKKVLKQLFSDDLIRINYNQHQKPKCNYKWKEMQKNNSTINYYLFKIKEQSIIPQDNFVFCVLI